VTGPGLGRERTKTLVGRTLGKWIVERRIGRGGMGHVYLARHTELGRPAAIKVLAPRLAQSPEYVRRFRSEAVAAARLNHPNLIQIYDVQAAGDLHSIVMEYVPGTSLLLLLRRRRRLHPHLAVAIAREVARGLHHAHTHGIVHRDIKPGNILLATRDARTASKFRVVLTDFGLCQDPDADPSLFESGRVMGTPYYVSPEQALGLRADDRSDLYSLGVTLFVMLMGTHPFRGRTPFSVLRRHIEQPVPPVIQLRPDLPWMLTRILQKLLRKDREDRYQIAAELLRDLDKFLKNRPLLRRAGASPSAAAKPEGNGVSMPHPIPSPFRSLLSRLILSPRLTARRALKSPPQNRARIRQGRPAANGTSPRKNATKPHPF